MSMVPRIKEPQITLEIMMLFTIQVSIDKGSHEGLQDGVESDTS